MGHEVTAYCRTYFTPPGMNTTAYGQVRLPTIRSVHLETLAYVSQHVCMCRIQPCDVVHYHALGLALFSFIPRLAGKKTMVTVQGLDWRGRNGVASPR